MTKAIHDRNRTCSKCSNKLDYRNKFGACRTCSSREQALNVLSTPKVRSKAAAAFAASRLPWLPDEFRPAYFALRAKRLTPAEARQLVEKDMKTAEKNQCLS